MRSWKRRRKLVAGRLLRFALSHSFVNGNFACYVLMPCRADALCMGVLAAWLVRRQDFWNLLLAKRAALRALAAFFFIGIAFMTYRQWDQFSSPMVIAGYSWLALFYTCCVLLAVSADSGGKKLGLSDPELMKLGTLAYCTYLIHFPLINAGRRLAAMFFPAAGNVGWLVGGLLGVAAALLIASVSWKYFEKPMLRRGHAYTY
jgi:peptidoglycan/LPS O-acetylase OafA/YrhL